MRDNLMCGSNQKPTYQKGMKIAGKKCQNIAENVHQMGYHYGGSSTESEKIEIRIVKVIPTTYLTNLR